MTAETLDPDLRRAITRVAHTPRLLVACDYDGTLAPIVADPGDAVPQPESISALCALAGLHETTTAVISGRALRDLTTLARLPPEVYLVGSHGSEFDAGFVHTLDHTARHLLRKLEGELDRLADGTPGVLLEKKPASIALHVRRAEPKHGELILAAVRSGPAEWDGVEVMEGKAVIELAVFRTDKGHALDIVRHQVGATAAVFIGDDVTDEKAFVRLSGPDLGIKVGDTETVAEYRVADTDEVAHVLAFLTTDRRTWLRGRQARRT
jgi:trehalose 6-phosphate phosphatase